MENELDNFNIKWINPTPRVKYTWNNLKKHKLEVVAKHLNIDFKPHKASEDAIATAKIIAIASIIKAFSLVDWGNTLSPNRSLDDRNSNKDNKSRSLIEYGLLNYGLGEIPEENRDILKGQIIVCTSFKGDDKKYFQYLVKEHGGKSPVEISSKTTCVFAGELWGPEHAKSKYKKVKELSVKVINKNKFFEIIKHKYLIE